MYEGFAFNYQAYFSSLRSLSTNERAWWICDPCRWQQFGESPFTLETVAANLYSLLSWPRAVVFNCLSVTNRLGFFIALRYTITKSSNFNIQLPVRASDFSLFSFLFIRQLPRFCSRYRSLFCEVVTVDPDTRYSTECWVLVKLKKRNHSPIMRSKPRTSRYAALLFLCLQGVQADPFRWKGAERRN